MRVLLIENDRKSGQSLKRHLQTHFAVDWVVNGKEGEFEASVNDYDAIVLSLMLPDLPGIEICRQLRARRLFLPMIGMAKSSDLQLKIKAFQAGIDDYLAKPFPAEELIWRLRAHLRRKPDQWQPSELRCGRLRLSTATREVYYNQIKIKMRRKEFQLLEYLMQYKNKTLSREDIFEHVWDAHADPLSNTIDVHIRSLRQKIEALSAKSHISTFHGIGYKLEENPFS